MIANTFKIGVVAASSRFARERGDVIERWFAEHVPDESIKVVFHPATFMSHGHFAGDDAARTKAFVEFANDPRLDAVARKKRYLGYSDAGSLLALLYKAGFPHVAHGPMASDVVRGDDVAWRALNWLKSGDEASLEPTLLKDDRPAVAFNLTILDQLLGTPLEPDLTGHVLMIEEVSEALYRIDRMMFHLTSQASIRRVAGIRLGSVTDVTVNDPDFGLTAEEIVRYWCQRSGIPYLGRARVGHDADNHVVPFGKR